MDREKSAASSNGAVNEAGSETTVIAFVNSVSGGQKGNEVLTFLKKRLGDNYVFDLKADKGPLRGLEMYAKKISQPSLQELAAPQQCPSVRALVCGGDGSFNWVSSTVFAEGFDVALIPVPLGTGNDLARALGWGFKYPGTVNLEKIVAQVKSSQTPSYLDLWTMNVKKAESQLLSDDAIASIPAPSKAKTEISEGLTTPLRETFCNYASFGVDAHVELKFNEGRWKNPDKYNSQTMNLLLHGVHGVRHMALESRIKLREVIKYVKVDGISIDIPSNIQALLFLSITSYGGGSNPWGNPGNKSFRSAAVNDGKLEVIGLKSLRHFIAVKLGISGVRLAQGSDIEIRLETDKSGPLPMQVDGEPWAQSGAILSISHGQHISTFIGPFHEDSLKTHAKFDESPGFAPKRSIRFSGVPQSDTMHAPPAPGKHRRAKSREAEDLPNLSTLYEQKVDTLQADQEPGTDGLTRAISNV